MKKYAQAADNTSLKTVTDIDKNKYYVYASVSKSGKVGTVQTRFEVNYYYKGTSEEKKIVDSYTKTLKAKANVKLSGGGTNSIGTTVKKSGSSYIYKPSKTFLYNVTSIAGTHYFSCNGATWSVSTYY